MKLIIVLIIVLSCSFADLRFNGFSGKWERAKTTDILKYNPFDKVWTFEHPDAQLKYNCWSNEWYFE